MLPRMKELRVCLKRVDEPIFDSEKNDSKAVPMRSTSTTKNSRKVPKKDASIYQCVMCKKMFQTKSSLHSHIRSHTREKAYKCSTCGLAFQDPRQLKTHQATHEITRPLQPTSEQCNKNFCNTAYLRKNVLGHGKKELKCPMCPKLFPDKRRIRSHLRTHNQEKSYSCATCNFRSKYQGSFDTHKRTPHANPCSHCDLNFVNKNQLKIHVQEHGGSPLHTCQICQGAFSTEKRLKIHSRKHTNEYRCDICNKCFTYRSTLSIHKLTHFKDKQFLCNLCYEDFESAVILNTHMKSKHADAGTFKCSDCTKTFATETAAKEHVIQAAVNSSEVHSITVSYKHPTYKCKLCIVRVSVESDLVKHMEVHVKPAVAQQFNCDFCKKSFGIPSKLFTHLRTHTGERPFQCPEKNCERWFVSSAGLIQHQEIHHSTTSRKLYRCTLCNIDKQYLLASLKNHMKRKHTGTKSESCVYENCKQSFIYKSELNRHVKIVHLREKPHKCGFCKYASFEKYDLTKHVATHTGEKVKPHACEDCVLAFPVKSQLERHVRAVHNKERRFICMFCKIGCFDKSDLEKHIKTHLKEKPEKCQICGRGFTQRSSLRKHMEVVHYEA